eukprot:7605724-Pyramimonas_sp.AAC.1
MGFRLRRRTSSDRPHGLRRQQMRRRDRGGRKELRPDIDAPSHAGVAPPRFPACEWGRPPDSL